MKVAVVTQFPVDPLAPHGGVEAVSVNLVRGLARLDDTQVHVVTLSTQGMTASISAWENATIHRLPAPACSMLRGTTGPWRRLIQDYLQKLRPDIVHAHDTYGLMVKGLPLPRVFTIHGFIYGDTEVSGKKWPWLRSRLWKRVETAGWADQPHIISISPYVRERVSAFAKKTIIHDIDNPISESFFHIARRPDPATIFSAAVISPRKNTLRLVQALLKLKEAGIAAQLRLAGPVVNTAYGDELLGAIGRYGLKDCVHLLGRIGTSQVEAELARATVFALVSLEENSPMGIQEAMAASVPVITSNRCGMPYMVRAGGTGFLVNPENPDNIARRLKQLLESQYLCARMGEEAHRAALSRFHPDLVARRTREVYLEAMA